MTTTTDIRIPAIEEFLGTWRANVREWYNRLRASYLELRDEQKARDEQAKAEGENYYGPKQRASYRKFQEDAKKIFNKQTYEIVYYWDVERLERLLDRDVVAKRNMFISRVQAKAGEILDASFLTVGMNGEINGLVIGDKAKVNVETIGAGGYNIQCFHFRVLVKEYKV